MTLLPIIQKCLLPGTEVQTAPGGGGGGGEPGENWGGGVCPWKGSHFHDWIDYHGVALSTEFPTELLEWRFPNCRDSGDKRILASGIYKWKDSW